METNQSSTHTNISTTVLPSSGTLMVPLIKWFTKHENPLTNHSLIRQYQRRRRRTPAVRQYGDPETRFLVHFRTSEATLSTTDCIHDRDHDSAVLAAKEMMMRVKCCCFLMAEVWRWWGSSFVVEALWCLQFSLATMVVVSCTYECSNSSSHHLQFCPESCPQSMTICITNQSCLSFH